MSSVSHSTHRQFLNTINNSINELIQSDPLLNHLPNDVTAEELIAFTRRLNGQSLTVYVKPQFGSSIRVIVDNEATVGGLKKCVQQFYAFQYKRKNGVKRCPINWKYIWSTYLLAYDSIKLSDDNHYILDYGIRNNCEICFIRKNSSKK